MPHSDNIKGYLRLGIPRQPQQYTVVKMASLGRPHPSSSTQTTDSTFGEKERGNQIHTRYYPNTTSSAPTAIYTFQTRIWQHASTRRNHRPNAKFGPGKC